MGTRALVGIELEDGTVRSSYVHYDGYPSGLGNTLMSHYDNPELLREAIELGDASFWAPSATPPAGVVHSFDMPHDGVSVYYDRDRGENSGRARTSKSIDACLETVGDGGEEFGYVFTVDGLWVMFDRYAKEIHWDAAYMIEEITEAARAQYRSA